MVAGSVRVGNSVDIIGGGFADGEVVTLQITHAGGTYIIDAGSVVADGGAFAALSVRLPSGMSAGDVAAVWATGDSGTRAVAPVTFN